MRIFTNKPFRRFADKEGITYADIRDAAKRIEDGYVDADLGGGVLKQRMSRPGQGRSGGFRSIVVYRREDRLIFVYGFAKSSKSNLRTDELRAFRELASLLLHYSDEELSNALTSGALIEVRDDEKDVQK